MRPSWPEVLAELEEHVRRAQDMLDRSTSATPAWEWTAPQSMPPIPPELEGRARELVGDMNAVRGRLGRYLAARPNVEPAQRPAVLLDRTA